MGTDCTPLLANLFLYSNEAGASQENKQKIERSFSFLFRYTDDVRSLNDSRFGNYVIVSTPIELEIKNSTDTAMSASYLDLHTEIDSEGRVRTKHYDKNRMFPW